MRGLQDAAAAGSQRCSQMCASLNSSHTDAPPVQTFQVSSNSLNHCLCLKPQMKAHLWLLVSILTFAPDPMWHHDCCRGEAARQQRWFPWVQLEILMVVRSFFLFWQQCSFIFSTIVFLSLPFKWMKAANSAQCCSGWQQWLREPWQHFFSGGIIGYVELVKCCKSEIYSDGLFSFIVCCCCFCTRPVLARWDRTNIGLSVKNIL